MIFNILIHIKRFILISFNKDLIFFTISSKSILIIHYCATEMNETRTLFLKIKESQFYVIYKYNDILSTKT